MYASWVFGVDILDLTFGMQMSRCWTSAFDDHFDHCFAVLKDVEHRNELRRLRVRRKTIDITQFKKCRIELESWFGFGCASLPVLYLWNS